MLTHTYIFLVRRRYRWKINKKRRVRSKKLWNENLYGWFNFLINYFTLLLPHLIPLSLIHLTAVLGSINAIFKALQSIVNWFVRWNKCQNKWWLEEIINLLITTNIFVKIFAMCCMHTYLELKNSSHLSHARNRKLDEIFMRERGKQFLDIHHS